LSADEMTELEKKYLKKMRYHYFVKE